ncbi:MAG: phenylalanine--tRNA ligase subunit beta [Acidobacteriaceae bacterium]|nr:phenylalanine--tRNA ligase subunit beta [Acidobacteriaceae bacterium]MBV9500525.1 phenylalanine--tRNA ligase subunit beta [Acidobacteriaceae bacterium]
MKFSYQWISELVPELTIEPAELQRLITMKTAECEGVESAGTHFANIIAARVLSVEPLPKGKNKLAHINIGHGKQVSVVCGAPNLRSGMLAPWVPPGTVLEGKTISRAIIDGVESEGMLASAAELGINRDHSGLLELEGLEPGQHLNRLRPDWIIEIDNKSLTHRPDLWGHYGMAREVAAIAQKSLRDPVDTAVLPTGEAAIHVEISNYDLCPRYSALVFENVKPGPSPLWLQARLEHLGMNPINNIVDVTNYILAELPQPMHAFDAEKLAGQTIYVRPARSGEQLRALNGELYSLAEADLVIADSSGPIALAGVIGGAESAISESTTRIVLESANFQAASVRLTSARHKLRTDASMRFEKALDPENTIRGLARAVELFRLACPGIQLVGGVADKRGPRVPSNPVVLPVDFVARKLGKPVAVEEIARILEALGFGVMETSSGVLTVTVPSWRATKDISIKDDLVEEVGRMIGYGEITPEPPLVASVVPLQNPMRTYLRGLRTQIAAQGFTEVHNYSFTNEAETRRFHFEIDAHLAIRNPIAAELTHMRRSLLPSVFKSIITNARHFSEFRLFEIGSEIHARADGALPEELPHLAAGLYNARAKQDFFEMKRVVECLYSHAQLRAADARPYEHPVRVAEIDWRGAAIGRLFELHPSLLQAEGLEGRAVLFNVDLQTAQRLAAAQEVGYTPLRKYPTSGFDLSVVAKMRMPVAEIEQHLTKLAGSDLAAINFIRQYAGPPLEHGQKSVSYRLQVGALDHTLTADEATSIRNRIVDGMRGLGFELRGLDSA